jgi:hypothetical protein
MEDMTPEPSLIHHPPEKHNDNPINPTWVQNWQNHQFDVIKEEVHFENHASSFDNMS